MGMQKYLHINPHVRFFWLPNDCNPDAIAGISGRKKAIYTPLSSSDISTFKSILEGNTIEMSSPLADWIVQQKWANWSNISFNNLFHEIGETWSRQLSYYCTFGTYEEAIKLHQKSCLANVLVVGIGGAGCHVTQELLGCGVRNISFIDSDKVEESNLNRQILFSKSDIGSLKVNAAVREVKRRMGHEYNCRALPINFLDWQPSESELKEYNLAIISADTPQGKVRRRASELFYKAGIPYAFLGYSGSRATCGPYVFSRENGCGCCTLHCIDYEDRLSEVRGIGMRFIPPSSIAINALLGVMFIEKWLRWLSGIESGNGLFHVDFGTNEMSYLGETRLPSCPVCGKV